MPVSTHAEKFTLMSIVAWKPVLVGSPEFQKPPESLLLDPYRAFANVNMERISNAVRISAIFMSLAIIGCGSSDSATGPRSANDENVVVAKLTSLRTASAKQYLAAIFSRYRNAASYHDRAQARLSYRVGDRIESKVAPLRVWLDHQRLYLEVYDVCLWSDENAMTAWIKDAATEDFDSQVLRTGPQVGRPEIAKLLSDPILAQKLAAGLAGPPPQLEWLFAANPMNQLFSDAHVFEYASTQSVDGFPCEGIKVNAGKDVYQFWIDKTEGLIRQVDLPPIQGPPRSGAPPQAMSLSLEMLDASFRSPESAPGMKSLPANPRYVHQFVPPPPPEPSRLFGSRPAEFELTVKSERADGFKVNERGSDRSMTLLGRFSGDAGSSRSAELLRQWVARLPEEMVRQVRVLVSVDPDAIPFWPARSELPAAVDRKLMAARSLNLPAGGLTVIDSNGRVAWMQSSVTPENLVTLGAVLSDIADGVDVPQRVHEQWAEQVKAYQRAVDAISVRK